MMKKQLFALVFLFLPFILLSQVRYSKDFKVETAKPYKVVDASLKLYFPVEEEAILSVKLRGENTSLQLFDANNMNEILRNEYDDFPKYSKLQDVVEVEGKMYYFFEVFNKKSDNFTLYCRQIDKRNAKFGKIFKLLTTSSPVVSNRLNIYNRSSNTSIGSKVTTKFNIKKSFDESKIMITYRLKPKLKNDNKNKDIIGVFVYDSDVNRLWSKEIIMPYTESVINNLAYGISGDATAYILIFHKDTKLYSALTLSKAGELKETKLDIDGSKTVQAFESLENKSGNIVFAGFYSEDFDLWKVMGTTFYTNGIMYFELNKKGNLVNANNIDFSIEMIKQYQTKYQKKKSEKRKEQGRAGIRDLHLINFSVCKDGSMYFTGEQRFISEKTIGKSNVRYFYFNDIVFIKLNPDASRAWMKKLPKTQSGNNQIGMLGARYLKTEDKHIFLFLDNKDNANLSINEVPKEYKVGDKNSILTAYIVDDETGKFKKHQILSLNDVGGLKIYQFDIWRILRINESTLMFEVYLKNKKDTMVKLELVE